MKLTKETLAHLKSVAEAATPGPWYAVGHYNSVGTFEGFNVSPEDDDLGETYNDEEWQTNKDKEFIADFNPQVALALLSRIEKLEGALKTLLSFSFHDTVQLVDTKFIKEALEGGDT